ncbi:MAG: rhodanese-like domain-containing protein [Planctomycetota bacterium]
MPDQPLDDRGLPVGYEFHDDYEITPRDTRDRLADPDDACVLVDVREADELRVAAIPKAMHFPLGRIADDHDDLADELPQGRGTPLLVLCHHGRRSLRATLALRQLGFADVLSVAGGTDLWSRDIDPALPRY